MSRAIHKLTPERTKQKSGKQGLHGDGGGLYLCVTSKTAASWVFRYMLKGKAREMGLGSYPEVSLDEARERARNARGRDPIEVRDAGRVSQALRDAKTLTFRHCAERYIAAQSENWTNAKHVAQWTTTLEAFVMPILGDVPVAAVDRAFVIPVFPVGLDIGFRGEFVQLALDKAPRVAIRASRLLHTTMCLIGYTREAESHVRICRGRPYERRGRCKLACLGS